MKWLQRSLAVAVQSSLVGFCEDLIQRIEARGVTDPRSTLFPGIARLSNAIIRYMVEEGIFVPYACFKA